MRKFPKIITEKTKRDFITQQFLNAVGYVPDLKSPKTFNEKIQWIKLNYHDPIMTVCADKYLARDYIKAKIDQNILINLAGKGVYEKVADIDFNELPNKFALKTTNGSGTNIICTNKNQLNIDDTKLKLEEWLRPERSHYYHSFEWAYRDIKPRIICEEFIEQMDGLKEYKFMCFNGKAEMLFVCSERDTQKLKIDFFDMEWSHLPFTRVYPNSSKKLKQPKKFNEMVRIAETLAEDFPFVRIDLYEIEDAIKFGEMTFYPGNGMERFDPVEWDRRVGDLLSLPAPKGFRRPFEVNPEKVTFNEAIKMPRNAIKRITGK